MRTPGSVRWFSSQVVSTKMSRRLDQASTAQTSFLLGAGPPPLPLLPVHARRLQGQANQSLQALAPMDHSARARASAAASVMGASQTKPRQR
jgi:hypothetical protein